MPNQRDPRLDFFRGAALFMIFFDHLESDPLSWLTYKRVGFSDAAEIFVFLSGISCSIAYSRILNRKGWNGLVTAVLRRAAYLYASCVTTGVITNFLVAAVEARGDQHIHLAFSGIASNFLLLNLPPLASILAAYIAFTLVVVPLYLLLSRVSDFAPLIASASIWIVSFLYFDFIGVSVGALLCWQFLFVIGMFVGAKYYCDLQPWLLPLNNRLLFAAWTVVVTSFVFKCAQHLHAIEWLVISEQMKWRLHPLRLIHFISVAFLVAAYFKESDVFFKTAPVNLVIYVGRNSLLIFCATATLTEVLNALLRLHPVSFTDRVIFDVCAVALFWLACWKVQKSNQISQTV